MQLGSLQWDMPLFLAPMAGFTDMSFRTVCKRHGCDVTATEMISAKGLRYGNRTTADLLETSERERPAVVQLFGREPEIMADMARRIEEEHAGKVLAIDINMGCPAPKITGNGEGSALMLEPALAGRIIARVAGAVTLPVTVKLRKGYDAQHENAVEMARIAEDNGAAALTVHGRTREQMYGGRADYATVAAVKAAVKISVIGNGDVTGGESAKRLLDTARCDGLMIGRGALGNPWIFEEIAAYLKGEPYTPPTWRERMETAVLHIRMTAEQKGERGILELRKHIVCYLRGRPGAAKLRTRLQSASTAEEMAQILLDTCG